ncbi:type II toxin-antitoxin system VapC family toxin [candidate division WOR-3 bacterium]|nr:type II toxin-antitoxin system VapC family toxin [candidate division WOR-3 bacterium]
MILQEHVFSKLEVYIDTGVFEGFFNKSDTHHEDARRGIERIMELGGHCIVLYPIIFETRKRFLHLKPRPRPDYARQFREMIMDNSLYNIEMPTEDEIKYAQISAEELNQNNGRLSDEDALLAYCVSIKGRRVFTFDNRHFNILEKKYSNREQKKQLRWWGWQS